MNIALGSTSTHKRDILQQALEGKLAYWGIELLDNNTSDSDQVVSLEQAVLLATKLAKRALSSHPTSNLGVGMEWGLEKIGATSNLTCVVVFWNGKQIITQKSSPVLLPQAVFERVKQGQSYPQLIQEYQSSAPPEEQLRIDQLANQELPFFEAITNALPQAKHLVEYSWRDLLYAYFAPRYKISTILTVSAGLAIIYFIGKTMLALVWDIAYILKTEAIWMMFNQLNIVAPLFLISWLVGLWLLLRSQVEAYPQIRFGLQLSLVTSVILILMSLTISWLTWPGVVGKVGWEWLDRYGLALTFYGLLIAVFFIAAHLYLFRSWWMLDLISLSTIILLIIGLICIPASWLPQLPWLSYGTWLFTPIMIAGLCWSFGLWRLGQELRSIKLAGLEVAQARPALYAPPAEIL